ncbi:MAG: hypothetical protein AAB276_04150, partial [Pseudomonadota bacterium]
MHTWIATGLLTVFGIWMAVLIPSQDRHTTAHYLYNTMASIMYFYGAYLAIRGLAGAPLSTYIGKMLAGLAAGLASFGVADLLWGYYNFVLQVEVPYPAFTDVFFILYYPGIIYGILSLLSMIKNAITPS